MHNSRLHSSGHFCPTSEGCGFDVEMDAVGGGKRNQIAVRASWDPPPPPFQNGTILSSPPQLAWIGPGLALL